MNRPQRTNSGFSCVACCRTPSVAFGSSPREAGRPLGPEGDGRCGPLLPVPAPSHRAPRPRRPATLMPSAGKVGQVGVDAMVARRSLAGESPLLPKKNVG